jgi:hypothetical protein
LHRLGEVGCSKLFNMYLLPLAHVGDIARRADPQIGRDIGD